MADLIAQGLEPQQRWRRPLTAGEDFVLGRESGAWSIPWDDRISRQHAEVAWRRGKLAVRQAEGARNPIFFWGRETAEFEVRPGEHFVIGQTTFSVVEDHVAVSLDAPQPLEEQTFSAQYLRRIRFHNADHRIDVLSRLPDLISGAASDNELFVRLVNMLLSGIARASAVAVVSVDLTGPQPQVDVLHWDRRLATEGEFQPSQKLILEAIERQQSVLHVWGGPESARQQFTLRDNVDWAFCTPVLGESSLGWAIYVAGRFPAELARSGSSSASESQDLREDLKFTELVSSTLSSLRQLRHLERKQASLSQFFAPAVLDAMTGRDPDIVLAPRETEVSVLFCDLRGFSFRAERDADNLLGLLERVSKALGVMTHHILGQGGVVGDFQGDAAMGFWGWPFPQSDAVQRACMAALCIRTEFEAAARREGHPLADFQVGIGLATGRAVAGSIGTIDQVKVTVFGPVVNLASRLEGLTRKLGTPILIDEATARVVRRDVPPRLARTRRLAKVRPYGLETALEVSELLPPADEYPDLSDEDLATYEQALDAFLAGDWTAAHRLLHRVPAQDQVKDFLTVHIAQHNRTPPAGWNGVIAITSK